MSQKYPGLYVYYDWMDALEGMEPEKAMTILKNLRYFSENDTEPPALSGWEGSIQNFMLTQLKRSKSISESCRARHRQKTSFPSFTPSDTVPPSEMPDDVRRIQEAIRRGMSRDPKEPPASNL